MKNILLVAFCIILPTIGCKDRSMTKLPDFDLMLPDSTVFNTKSIPEGSPIVVIYYDGECVECHEEVKGITSRMNEVKDVRFYLITLEPLSEIKRFKDFLKLDRFSNIIVAKDTANFFPKYLKAHTTPIITLYDERKSIKKIYTKRPPIDTLIKHIRKLQTL